MASLHEAQPSIISCVVYILALLTLINSRPLWLDEVIQLVATSQATLRGLISHMIQNSGAAPLGYLAACGRGEFSWTEASEKHANQELIK